MFLAKSYCDIGNSQSSSSIVAPDGEITTTFEYDGIQRLVRVTDTEGNVMHFHAETGLDIYRGNTALVNWSES